MEPKDFSTINLTQKEIKDIQQFCNLNKIEDIPTFLHTCAWKGYEVEKFGILGKTGGIQEKRVEIEVIREKRVEIPVEVIKEVIKVEYVEVPVEVIKEVIVDKIVEVIKEVPVDKVVIQEVIKEVPVEKVVTKIEYISDKTGESELFGKIEQLEEEMSKKNNELDELRRNLDIILDKPPVEIEKIVEVDKSSDKLKMMSTTLQNLRNDLSLKNDKITELERINQELQKTANLQNAIYMKGSNLNSRI